MRRARVSLHSNRYSVPATFIGRRVEVRETREKIEIEFDARRIVTHTRLLTADQRVTLSEHRPPRGEGHKRGDLHPQPAPRRHPRVRGEGHKRGDSHPDELAVVNAAPEIAPYVESLKRKGRKVFGLASRQLPRMVREYPREPLLGVIAGAAQYGLDDLDRVERMILRRDFFLLEGNDDGRTQTTAEESQAAPPAGAARISFPRLS